MTTPVKIHRRQKETAAAIGRQGKIVVWTMIRVAAKSFNRQVPYPVVIVKLKNGEQVIGQLVDWQQDDLQTGKDVISVLRRTRFEDNEGVISYVIKFKPI